MKKIHYTLIYSLPLILGLLLFFLYGTEVFAQEKKYTPLVGLPGITNLESRSFAEYVNALYVLTISIGALIGVFRISMAGVKYSMSDVVTSKEDAKEDIQGVLIGLAILLLPFTVLNTINPDLVKLDVLKLESKVQVAPSKSPSTGGGGNGPGNGSGNGLGSSMTTVNCPAQYRTTVSLPTQCGEADEGTFCPPTAITTWNESQCQSWCYSKPSPTYIAPVGDGPPKCRYSLSVEVTGS